ncbi:hypothetical protein [Nocardia niigatensis]
MEGRLVMIRDACTNPTCQLAEAQALNATLQHTLDKHEAPDSGH